MTPDLFKSLSKKTVGKKNIEVLISMWQCNMPKTCFKNLILRDQIFFKTCKEKILKKTAFHKETGRKYLGYKCDKSVTWVTLYKFSVEKYYFDGNVPYEIFKSWNNKCGYLIKTDHTISENANVYLQDALK